jgi:hypothetical protein
MIDPQNDRFTQVQDAFRQYCTEYPDSYDCQCFVREQDEVYRRSKDALGGAAVNDVCWYKPCAYQTNIFVPSQLSNVQVNCPSVCANVIIAADVGGSIDINNVSINNQCFQAAKIETINTSDPANPAIITNTPMIVNPTTITTNPQKQQESQNIISIIVLCVVVFVLILFVIVIIGSRRSKSSDSIQTTVKTV